MKNYKIVVVDREKVILKLSERLECGAFTGTMSYPGKNISATTSLINELARFDILLSEDFIGSAFREILSFSVPFLFLFVARVDSGDQLFSLEIGVRNIIDRFLSTEGDKDLYKTKPKSDRLSFESGNLAAGPIAIDSRNLKVSVREFEICLTPIEFNLLELLASNPEKVFSRQELMAHLYGPDGEDHFRTIDSHISHIRKKIARHLPKKNVIRTIYGNGYSLRIPKEG